MTSETPMEDAIRAKVGFHLFLSPFMHSFGSYTPGICGHPNNKMGDWAGGIEAQNAHHKPMQGSTSGETHFRIVITSEAFRSKMQPARHRLVYGLLRDEMAAEGGIHALQLRTMTPEEERQKAKEEAEKA
ncbi:hypothetical protein NUW58_g3918 [Xylaria curta]|uniref:Uncharacterized protein n=1 Tax=Xylaria curta TaxID=42375 RepID=A0ACC1PA76_9PEZI|nr:hypothetical protein NUW58_g3918 [Xylaria curta]